MHATIYSTTLPFRHIEYHTQKFHPNIVQINVKTSYTSASWYCRYFNIIHISSKANSHFFWHMIWAKTMIVREETLLVRKHLRYIRWKYWRHLERNAGNIFFGLDLDHNLLLRSSKTNWFELAQKRFQKHMHQQHLWNIHSEFVTPQCKQLSFHLVVCNKFSI